MAEAGNLVKDPIQQKLSKYTITLMKQDTQILVSQLRRRPGCWVLYGGHVAPVLLGARIVLAAVLEH
jgi:hypothetical protein